MADPIVNAQANIFQQSALILSHLGQ